MFPRKALADWIFLIRFRYLNEVWGEGGKQEGAHSRTAYRYTGSQCSLAPLNLQTNTGSLGDLMSVSLQINISNQCPLVSVNLHLIPVANFL